MFKPNHHIKTQVQTDVLKTFYTPLQDWGIETDQTKKKHIKTKTLVSVVYGYILKLTNAILCIKYKSREVLVKTGIKGCLMIKAHFTDNVGQEKVREEKTGIQKKHLLMKT